MINPDNPTIEWRIVSVRLKASRPAKFGKSQPNIAMKEKNAPLTRQNGFQNFLLFQPNFRIVRPNRVWNILCIVSALNPNLV